jgi:uncharacterized membrane protein
MIFGYAKQDKLILITGAVLMPVFIFLYYYNLDINFLVKSGILIGSGAILLAGYGYMAVRKLHGRS